MERSSFIGLNGFVWWIGIVENRKDPLNVGRCQVRIFGWHTDNKNEIPTEDLPWAQPILPTNSSTTFSTPKEGDMVVGFFMDASGGQFPIMMGVMPGIPDGQPNYSRGFSDPRTSEELNSAPALPKKVEYKTDGSGAKVINQPAEKYPKKENLDEPTNTRMSRNENIEKTPFNDTLKNTVKDVKVAQHTNVNSIFSFSSKITSGFGIFDSLGSIFSSLTSLPNSLADIVQSVAGKVTGTFNLPQVVNSQLTEKLPNASSEEITKASNVGFISSILSDLGIPGFDADNEEHIQKIDLLPNITSYNFEGAISKYNVGLTPNFESLKTDLKETANIDITGYSNETLAKSLNTNFNVNSLSNSITDLTNFDMTGFTSNLNKYGISVLSGEKETSEGKWREPKPSYNPKYPYNNSTETESGHIFELDDTPNKERVHLRHRSGTFVEIRPDGTQVEKVVKDKYQIIMSDDHVEIQGSCKISVVNSTASVFVKQDCTLEVEGNLNTTIKKDWNLNVEGSVNWNIGKDFKSTVKGDSNQLIQGKTAISSGGDANISSAKNTTLAALGKMYLISVDDLTISAPKVLNNTSPEDPNKLTL